MTPDTDPANKTPCGLERNRMRSGSRAAVETTVAVEQRLYDG